MSPRTTTNNSPDLDPNSTEAPTDDMHTPSTWHPLSWTDRPSGQPITYPDGAALSRSLDKLKTFPPLVTSGEVERLTTLLSEAQDGRRFMLQGGDCAETLDDCRSEIIAAKLKILLQMSLVMVHGLKKPVIRVGRFAGQYAKPRSSPIESRDGVELPSYYGDLVNRVEFDEEARTPNPHLLVRGYQHAAVTLNFIRSLLDGGFADLHHPDNWDLGFLNHARLRPSLRAEYKRMTDQLAEALRFMEALGDSSLDELSRVEFFTSHEGLNLWYESAQTRQVPRKSGWWDLTTHLPWIGERTRALDGAHIEYFRGVRNPVGVKVGPSADPDEVVKMLELINPTDQPGKVVLIHRMGANRVEDRLQPILEAVADSGRKVLWTCDPMHGNTVSVGPSGIKTRRFDDILSEIEAACDAHDRVGTYLGGVHFELTGEDVTECIGGGSGVTEDDLERNYASPCDPRLNYQQALEMAFLLSRRLSN